MATDGSEEVPPSFFKVIRFPSASHLALPVEFAKRHLEKIPKNAVLKTKTAIGGNSWRLKVKKIGEEYCFCNGWEKLAKDVQFRSRDLVFASLIDPFTFEVMFFDADGCEKDLSLNKTNFSGEANDEEVDDEVIADEEGDDEVMPTDRLCFQKVFSEKFHKDTMGLPKKFVEAAELENESGIHMKDHEGKAWIMGLTAEKNNRRSLSSGWSLFRQYYEISEGDIMLFRFIKEEGVLSLAQVLKNNRARKQETSSRKETPGNVLEGVKRKRGRPFKKKRGRPHLEKPRDGSGGVKVKSENESGPEVVKRKRGRPPLRKHHGGGVEVKIEDQSGPEAEVVKRKRGRPRVEKRHGGSGGGVKTEDRWGAEVVAVKRKRGRPRVEKRDGGGVKVKIEDGDGSVVKRKRGRPPAVVEKVGGVGVEVKVEEEVEVEVEEVVVEEVKRKPGRPPVESSRTVITERPPVESSSRPVIYF